jgi:hypothetical protein
MWMKEMSKTIFRKMMVEQAFQVGPTTRRSRKNLPLPWKVGSASSILRDAEVAIKAE